MIEVESLRRPDYRVPSHATAPCVLCGLECLPGTRRTLLVAEINGRDQIISPYKEVGSIKAPISKVYLGPDCLLQHDGKLRKYQLPG